MQFQVRQLEFLLQQSFEMCTGLITQVEWLFWFQMKVLLLRQVIYLLNKKDSA